VWWVKHDSCMRNMTSANFTRVPLHAMRPICCGFLLEDRLSADIDDVCADLVAGRALVPSLAPEWQRDLPFILEAGPFGLLHVVS